MGWAWWPVGGWIQSLRAVEALRGLALAALSYQTLSKVKVWHSSTRPEVEIWQCFDPVLQTGFQNPFLRNPPPGAVRVFVLLIDGAMQCGWSLRQSCHARSCTRCTRGAYVRRPQAKQTGDHLSWPNHHHHGLAKMDTHIHRNCCAVPLECKAPVMHHFLYESLALSFTAHQTSVQNSTLGPFFWPKHAFPSSVALRRCSRPSKTPQSCGSPLNCMRCGRRRRGPKLKLQVLFGLRDLWWPIDATIGDM